MTAAQFSADQRERLARSGVAMKGGGFPIRNRSDLKNAIMAFGRAGDKAAAKRHIIKRAKALDAVDALPEGWGVTASLVASSKNARKRKIDKVMAEFKAGTLKSSTGAKVTDRKQALAIALSEARSVTAATFDESKHPRNPEGSKGGGQFRAIQVVPVSRDTAEVQVDGETIGEIDLAEASGPEGMDQGAMQEQVVDTLNEQNVTHVSGRDIQDAVSEAAGTLDGTQVDSYATGDFDQADFDAIESHAKEWLDQGYEPSDSEPGEWLQLTDPETGHVVTIGPDGPEDEEDSMGASALTAAAAGLAPLTPPKTWFENPKLEGPTPITVTADGRVFGHAALWGTCHTGVSGVCRTPPRSQSGYRYFHLGEVDTDGGPVHVGRVTMNTGHAPLTASREQTVRHYDDTGTCAAHVCAYEDEHGIVLAGSLLPDIPAEQARRLKGALVSGDWRSIGGQLEMVGMLAVNVPGFPVPRAMAASLIMEDEPHTMSLVAAGVYCSPEDEARKLKALVARAKGVDGLVDYAMGGSKQQRRMGVTAAGRPFDSAKHPRKPKGPGGGQFANLAGLSDEAAAEAIDAITFNDKVTIMIPAGGGEFKEKTGRARIKSSHGWALNMGGAHGTPGVATERNIVKVKPGSKA